MQCTTEVRVKRWWLRTIDDTISESSETVVLTPMSGTTAGSSVTYTIKDNDAGRWVTSTIPNVTAERAYASVEEGKRLLFFIALDKAPQPLCWDDGNGNATALCGNNQFYVKYEISKSPGGVFQTGNYLVGGSGTRSLHLFVNTEDDVSQDVTYTFRVIPSETKWRPGPGYPTPPPPYNVDNPSFVTATVTDNDQSRGSSVQASVEDQPTTDGVTVDPQLIADVRSYMAETYNGADHVNRWKRVLEAFGVEEYPGLEPMTSDEAQTYADQGWSRWDPVVTALEAIEDAPPATSPQILAADSTLTIASDAPSVSEGGEVTFTISASPPPQLDTTVNLFISQEMGDGLDYVGQGDAAQVTIPAGQSSVDWTLTAYSDNTQLTDGTIVGQINTGDGYTLGDPFSVSLDLLDDDAAPTGYTVDPAVVAQVQALASQTQHGADHVNRWQRVLVAFGVLDASGVSGGAMTAAEAQQMADNYSSPVWDLVVAELTALEAGGATNPPVVVPAVVIPPMPEVNILSSSGGSEGATVSFTISANPAPSANLSVGISVVTTGDFGYGSIPSSVTIPPSGSVTLSITTTDDSVDESDGSVSLTLNSGNGYTVGSLGSESVSVTDDDVTVAPVVVPDPVVSISAGASVTEGGNVEFTVTASPSPSADLPVSVTVSQSGDFGASTGSRTVTIPTSGSVTFAIATSDDSTDESDGSVTATVNTGSGYTVSSSQGAGTVAVSDNDVPPTPVVSISAGNAVTEGGNVEFTVTASPRPTSNLPVSVTVSQSGDFGASTGSRTVTIPTSGSVTLSIATSDDSTDESDGSVTATLVDGAAYDLGANKTGTVAVSDNDDPPPSSVTVSVADASGQEYEWVVDFSVTLSEASSEAVSVRFTTYAWRGATRETLSQRAKMFIDYQLTDTTVVFAPGETERTVSVWLTDDSRSESEEHFTVELSDPQGASIGQGEATGTILDDD